MVSITHKLQLHVLLCLDRTESLTLAKSRVRANLPTLKRQSAAERRPLAKVPVMAENYRVKSGRRTVVLGRHWHFGIADRLGIKCVTA